MKSWRYACSLCGSVNIRRVAKGKHDRESSKTHYYCECCRQHSKTKVDRKRQIEIPI